MNRYLCRIRKRELIRSTKQNLGQGNNSVLRYMFIVIQGWLVGFNGALKQFFFFFFLVQWRFETVFQSISNHLPERWKETNIFGFYGFYGPFKNIALISSRS